LAVGGTVATGIGRVFPEPSVNGGSDGNPVSVPLELLVVGALVVLALEVLEVLEVLVDSAGSPVFVFVFVLVLVLVLACVCVVCALVWAVVVAGAVSVAVVAAAVVGAVVGLVFAETVFVAVSVVAGLLFCARP
jgi:hypothetical protein